MKISWWRGREKGENTLFKIVVLSLSCVWLCNAMDCRTPHSPALHYLPKFAQIHIHWVSDVTSSDLGGSSPGVISFCLFIQFMEFSRQECWSGLPFPPPMDTFCRNPALWPVHLEWPCTAWLIASLSHTSLCTTTRLWPMKGFFQLMFS